MPYKSRAQAAYMHIHHPEIAHKWDKEYPENGKLPKHVKGSKYASKKPLEGLRKAHK